MTALPPPLEHFEQLFALAQSSQPKDPNAMVLSTVAPDGRPSSRVVLLKGFDARGFVFYTNLDSRKGRELRDRPVAALCFHWHPLEQQVRIEGRVEQVSDEEADAYFATRPRGSQLGAWASRQSSALPSRAELDASVAEVTARFEGQPVPRPPFWSGFRLVPDRLEFWKGRSDRLHERTLWTLERGTWRSGLLYPLSAQPHTPRC
jgi:pyridoxamine 5'-phosphate oxidase